MGVATGFMVAFCQYSSVASAEEVGYPVLGGEVTGFF
jgi:hypothetical protein